MTTKKIPTLLAGLVAGFAASVVALLAVGTVGLVLLDRQAQSAVGFDAGAFLARMNPFIEAAMVVCALGVTALCLRGRKR